VFTNIVSRLLCNANAFGINIICLAELNIQTSALRAKGLKLLFEAVA